MTQPNREHADAFDPTIMAAEAGTLAAAATPCEGVLNQIDEVVRRDCRRKVNHLRHCSGEQERCPCSDVEGQESRCIDVEMPRVEPCISISWGDSKCDCAETDDTEVLCITVCNCYTNVTFQDLTIAWVQVIGPGGGPVPTLPDGTPSVQIRPRGPICFGDIEPCRDNRGTCVSREVVLITRGAKGGDYRVIVGPVCFSVCWGYATRDCFVLPLCPD